ncbi:MAG TPA: DUF1028 domain-containing protein [candidate division Zixibacteria bacterium]|nr:DUF1028 domain-containing protein [candidate division Zixibacteria bacterium]
MKKSILSVFSTLLFFVFISETHATFSIVAVDTVTGTVGSAGASCIENSYIINDVVEGIGAVNTQSFWVAGNQNNAHTLLMAGVLPDSIMEWLEANDVGNDPQVRQYGAATLAGPSASASFTGSFCIDWRGHRFGPTYAIQGNILLDSTIVENMETAFLNATGPLEDRLMAALEAAKVVGADTRCTSSNKSSISAYIKVVRIGDGATPYLYERVNNTPVDLDPIDSLRVRYDAWKLRQQADAGNSEVTATPDKQKLDGISTVEVEIVPKNLDGDTVRYSDGASVTHTGTGGLSAVVNNGDKTFSATLTAPPFGTIGQRDTLTAFVDAGGINVQLGNRPVVTFYPCGDMNGDLIGLNILDLNFLVNRIFRGGVLFAFPPAANLNGDGTNGNVLDLNSAINRIFRSGPPVNCGW